MNIENRLTDEQIDSVLMRCVEVESNPDFKFWRKGQIFFNVLHDMHPDTANEIRSTHLDPFHNDEIIPQCITEITEYEEV